MRGESLFFIARAGGLPAARLLFAPQEILEVRSASGAVSYEAGRDYRLDRATKTLFLPAGSRIPFVTAAEIRPPQGSPHTLEGMGTPQRGFLWSEGHFFHDLQTAVTYRHTDQWQGAVPAYAGELLPRTAGKLLRRQPLEIVVLGDSVSVGYNASGFVDAAPQQQPYTTLVKLELERAFGAPVGLTVFAAPGETTDWGLQQTAAVVAARPDLVMLAFGINDSLSLAPETYLSNTRAQIERIQTASPDAEFIVVSSSLPNPDLSASRIEILQRFAAGLREFPGPGVALADMTAVWTELLAHKNYLDISGNGINHPNDFGHRCYAQVITELLRNNSAPR